MKVVLLAISSFAAILSTAVSEGTLENSIFFPDANSSGEIRPQALEFIGNYGVAFYYDAASAMSWEDADKYCKNHQPAMSLGEIQTEGRRNVLSNLAGRVGAEGRGIWIGGRSFTRSVLGYRWNTNRQGLIADVIQPWEQNGVGLQEFCILLAVYPDRQYFVPSLCNATYNVLCQGPLQ